MWDTIKEIYLSVNKTSGDRIKSPFYGVYVFTWLAFNWESVAIFIFSDMKMENRVSFINSSYPFSFIVPLIISVSLTILLPFINEKFSYLQSKPLTRTSIILAMRRKKALLADIGVERFRAKRDVTYDRYKVGAEREMQAMKEQIVFSKNKIGEITEEKEAAINEKNLIIIERNKATEEIRKLINETTSLRVTLTKSAERIEELEMLLSESETRLGKVESERDENQIQLSEVISKLSAEKEPPRPTVTFSRANRDHNR